MSTPAQVTIRRAVGSDIDAIASIFDGPKAVSGTLQLPYPHPERYKGPVVDNDPNNIILVACAGDEVVGHLGIHLAPNPRRKHTCELGMAVRDDWQGMGVGTALMQAAVDMCDRWLNISRIELAVYVDNVPARRLYEKFGFVSEGVHKMHAFRDGVYVDTMSMARLRKPVNGL
ncbi:MAG: GNAT family N-acetyltransferase [Chloroflexi bacterium]|nr:GNAT family N-acetyltransferase [Chloroflexota bacterium]